MIAALTSSWALLLGMGILLLGNALLGTVLGLRAELENFSTATVGYVFSGYFLGFMAGSWLTPKIVGRVGHIRVFAALASLCSASVLVYVVLIDPYIWFAMRVMTGFCFAGLYIVSESWLNDKATNENRGQLLSVYVVTQLLGMTIGQSFVGVLDPGGFTLFVVISVLVSLALIPILLTASRQPEFTVATPIGLRDLYTASPLGMVGAVLIGGGHAVLFHLLPTYGAQSGLGNLSVAAIVSASYVGGMILQFPIGRLSDRYDRRLVITGVALAAGMVALAGALVGGMVPFWGLVGLIALFGGLTMPLYPLLISHTNDYVPVEKMVAAGAGLILVFGVGGFLGPSVAGLLMQNIGPSGLFWWCAGVHFAVVIFALYRMTRRASLPSEEQGSYVPFTQLATSQTLAISPEYEQQLVFDFIGGEDEDTAADRAADADPVDLPRAA